MKPLRIALAASLLMTGAAASAQSATDARCLILSNSLAQTGETDQDKKIGETSFYFYLGRIAPTATATQLKALFDAQAKTISEATAATSMTACATAVGDKVKLLQTVAGSNDKQQPQGR